MIWLNRILTFLIGFGAVWGVAFLVVTTYGWEKVWTSISGSADLGTVQFEGLAKGPMPNQVLICPDGLCRDEDRDRASPIYAVDMTMLKTALEKSLEAEPGLMRVDDGSDASRLRYVQRSRLMRFPDTIRIKFYPRENGTGSTLALYGQSQIGSGDFGVNLKRANRWLNRLSGLEK